MWTMLVENFVYNATVQKFQIQTLYSLLFMYSFEYFSCTCAFLNIINNDLRHKE